MSGAEVSTITESFYKEFLAQGREVIDVTSYIRTSASQGLEIPYVGYVELQLTAFSHKFEGLGFLIVKDPVSTPIQARKKRVPSVLGSNVLRDLRKSLVYRYGGNFAELLSSKTATDSKVRLLPALLFFFFFFKNFLINNKNYITITEYIHYKTYNFNLQHNV